MLRRVPSAKKPVTKINNRTMRGSIVLFGGSCDEGFIRLARKNRVPDSRAMPSISVNKDKIRAGTRGMLKSNWARMTMIKGITNPQNKTRCVMPAYRFFRIFFCPRRYPKSPAQSPRRCTCCPCRHADQRLENPAVIIIMARAMSNGSKAVNNGLSPQFRFSGKSTNIKPESTPQQHPHEDLVNSGRSEDDRLFLRIGPWMNITK